MVPNQKPPFLQNPCTLCRDEDPGRNSKSTQRDKRVQCQCPLHWALSYPVTLANSQHTCLSEKMLCKRKGGNLLIDVFFQIYACICFNPL